MAVAFKVSLIWSLPQKKKKVIFLLGFPYPVFILDMGAFSISRLLEYDQLPSRGLPHTSATLWCRVWFGVVRYSGIEGQTPGCLVKSSSLWSYSFCLVSLNCSPESFCKKGQTSYDANCAPQLTSFCDNLDLNLHFLFVLVSPMLLACWGCKTWASKSFPLFAWSLGSIQRDQSTPAENSHAVTMPVYLCKTLQCTYVHNFVKTLRNYTNLFMSSFFVCRIKKKWVFDYGYPKWHLLYSNCLIL